MKMIGKVTKKDVEKAKQDAAHAAKAAAATKAAANAALNTAAMADKAAAVTAAWEEYVRLNHEFENDWGGVHQVKT
jgi:hypothetical protein